MDLSIAAAGMQAQSTAFDTAARGIARSFVPSSGAEPQGDSVDLSASAVALLQAKTGFEANVKTAELEDDMMKSTLSMVM